ERNRQLAESEAALRRQTVILQAVLHSMADGVAVADEHGKFLLFNPAAERILGFGPMDVTPEEWSEHYGCYLADGMTPCPVEKMPLVRAIRGEDVDDFEEYIKNPKRPDGVWLSVSARPLLDETGAVRGGVSVYRDISAHKFAEEARKASERRFRDLFQ